LLYSAVLVVFSEVSPKYFLLLSGQNSYPLESKSKEPRQTNIDTWYR
jgi:hypothetical protein